MEFPLASVGDKDKVKYKIQVWMQIGRMDRMEGSLHLTSSAPCTRWCSLGIAATLVSL